MLVLRAVCPYALPLAVCLSNQGFEDALHIALATVYDVDYLLTWNCRHIANPEIQRGIAAYLEQVGLSLPFICTPEELLGEENAE